MKSSTKQADTLLWAMSQHAFLVLMSVSSLGLNSFQFASTLFFHLFHLLFYILLYVNEIIKHALGFHK